MGTFEGETLGVQASRLHRGGQDARAPKSNTPDSEQVQNSVSLRSPCSVQIKTNLVSGTGTAAAVRQPHHHRHPHNRDDQSDDNKSEPANLGRFVLLPLG